MKFLAQLAGGRIFNALAALYMSRACSDSISWRQNFLRIYGRYVNCERHDFLRKNCRRDTISGRQILIPVTPG